MGIFKGLQLFKGDLGMTAVEKQLDELLKNSQGGLTDLTDLAEFLNCDLDKIHLFPFNGWQQVLQQLQSYGPAESNLLSIFLGNSASIIYCQNAILKNRERLHDLDTITLMPSTSTAGPCFLSSNSLRTYVVGNQNERDHSLAMWSSMEIIERATSVLMQKGIQKI
jgi:hypothetical protein